MTSWEDVDDTCLKADDYQDVRKELAELNGLWKEIGQCLGLTPADIREIDLANRGDPQKCRDEVIERWLNQNYDCKKFGQPSWRKLVSAVAERNGGRNPAQAKEIAQRHKNSHPAPPPSDAPSSGTAMPGGAVGLKVLVDDLAMVAHKWYYLGLQLGVNVHDLEKIRGEGNEAQNSLCKVLHQWLSNAKNPTKEDLVTVLQSNAISEKQLARRLTNSKDIPDKLDKQHFSALVTFLDPVASKWEDIAIQLDLDHRKVESFKQGGTDVDRALRKMLTKVKDAVPQKTVKDLCNALSSPTVGEKTLAAHLSNGYSRNGKMYLFETEAE